MGSSCSSSSSIIIIISAAAVAFAAATVVHAAVLGQDASESEGRRAPDPPISQVASKRESVLLLPSPPRFSSKPSHMPLPSSSSEQMRPDHQFLPTVLPEEANMRTASVAGIASQHTKAQAEAQAKGPIMTSLASVFALSFFHKEKMKRCCALRLCPCRGQMGFPPGHGPGGMAGFPGPGGMGMYPGMRPGMGGFRPGMGGGFGGMGGGGGGGEDEGNEELQDGFEDVYTYHVRPGSRPAGMQKRKRPISARPHHLRPDMVAASAPSPDTNYPAMGESGMKWTSGSEESDVAGTSDHVTGGMLAERRGEAAAGASALPSPVSRRLMSVEMHPGLTGTHEEDMSCSSRSLGVVRNSPSNEMPGSRSSRVIATVARNDGHGISSREAEGMRMDSDGRLKQNAPFNPRDAGLL